MRFLKTAVLVVALAAPAYADVRLAKNNLRVEFAGGQFEVFTKAGWSPAALFCAAGDVARISGAKSNDTLVVTRNVGQSPTRANRRSASFELVPRSEAKERSFFTLTAGFGPGLTKSVGAAVFACEQESLLRNRN